MQKAPYDIVVFLIVVSGLIIFMIAFIISIFYLYRKKQNSFINNLEQLKLVLDIMNRNLIKIFGPLAEMKAGIADFYSAQGKMNPATD